MATQKELSVDHPLRSAVWIWPEGYMYLYNHFAHFRRDFDLAAVPEKAPFFITADKAYKLYVNGKYVCRGPARGYQSHWPFDEVDLAPFLNRGHNWISIEAYNPGISTFQYLHQTEAGLLCAAKWGDFSLVTDKQWLCRRSPGHSMNTARYSMQIDFQEHFDARTTSREWVTDAVPPEGWKASINPTGQMHTSFPYGRPPWETLEPRGIPLMAEEIVTPAALTAHASGQCGEGYADWQNVTWGWMEEVAKVERWGEGSDVRGRKNGDWMEVEIEPSGKGRYSAVTIDIGRMVVANLAVEVEGAKGGEIVDFQHDQCLRQGHPVYMKPGDACWIGLGNRLRLAAGRTEHEFFHILGFRHVTIIARDVTAPLRVRLKARAAGYPFTMKGRFECSDSTLNDIYMACRQTQKLCALDSYVDTPWREQAQWWGDARVQARNTFYLDGDARLLARGSRSISAQRTSQGLTYGHAPTSAHNCILPDFSLTWILTIWDYYWQTGDLKLFKEQWPGIRAVLNYFLTPEARSAAGLLRYDTRLWYFGDWAELFRGELPAFLNLWYLFTLRTLVKMLELARKPADTKKLTEEADALERLVIERFYDGREKLFCDGVDRDGKPARRWSVHEQTLALMLGITPEAHQTMIEKRLLPYLRGEKVDGALPSAFWCTYVLEEMAKRGYTAEAVDFIRRKWSPMLTTGTTWEGFDWDEKAGWSCSHAWTAHPSFHFVNMLAGITQTKAAWAGVRFAPSFVAGIDRAEAVVPSPEGPIKASWKRAGSGATATISLPKHVTAEIELPGEKKTVAGKGEFDFRVETL
jgi:hypothetical protein